MLMLRSILALLLLAGAAGGVLAQSTASLREQLISRGALS
jgi:hypothetical protein